MSGQNVGYIRVSSFDQNPDRQLEGVNTDRVFSDKASGSDVDRPQLDALLKFVRDGDTVVIHSLDRLAATSTTSAASCRVSPLVACRCSSSKSSSPSPARTPPWPTSSSQ